MILLKILWFLLPSGAANIAPVFAAKIFPSWNYPLDFNKSFMGKRIFGAHKTIRGLVSGIFIAEIVFLLQKILFTNYETIKGISIIDYSNISILIGSFMGFGCLIGDAVKSFFKRRFDVKEGRIWFPWDQIDWILGTLVVSYFFIKIPLFFIVLSVLLGLLLHIIIKFFGYILKINKTPI